jgi:integrase
MTVVLGFYEFHTHMGTVGGGKNFTRFNVSIGTHSKSFLSGIAKVKPRRKSLLKLKEPKKFVGCLIPNDIETLVKACHNIRDKLIIMIFYETGIRKGELLGLRHEDIGSTGENEVSIIKRNNVNGRESKVVKELLMSVKI